MKITGGTIVAVLVFGLAGCGGGESSAARTFTVRGTAVYPTGGGCDLVIGQGGISVTVLNASGKKVGISKLGEGKGDELTCRFAFRVPDVPDGDEVYSLQLGSGTKTYDFKRAKADKVSIIVTKID